MFAKINFKFIKSRIPYILAYFLVSLAVVRVVDYVLFKHVLPDSWFVRNYSMTVSTTKEHNDVSVRVCRDRRGDFIASGERRIYVIPEGKEEDEKQFAGEYSLDSVAIDGDRCDLFSIKTSQFDHSAGRYQAITEVSFPVKYGRVVNVEYRSNVYDILEATEQDIQQRIKELQEQLNRLEAIQKSKTAKLPNTGQTPTQSEPTPSITPENSEEEIVKLPEQPSSQPAKPIEILPTICVPLTNICVNGS